MRNDRRWLAVLAAGLMIASAGCFAAPIEKPPAPAKNSVTLAVPYYLTWDAVNAVVLDNNYKIAARDPNNGIIETEASGFSLKDADCGEIKGVAGHFAAEPGDYATAVYNFYVKATGRETSTVRINATFSAPLHVPLRPTRNIDCVSRGVVEARLLKQIQKVAAEEHRPAYLKTGQAPQFPANIGGRQSITAPSSPPSAETGFSVPQGSNFGSKASHLLMPIPALPAPPPPGK
ncbi:MAG: hypothetical protein ACREP6_00640 [Candidatus Binataceae bacterium]